MDITAFEIIKALIVKLKKENIYYFSKKELLEQLIIFSKNESYKSLFNDKIDINETIKIFVKCGYLYELSTDQDTVYIIKSSSIVDYNELLDEALSSYCNFRKICDNYKNLKFEVKQPNGTYMLVEGRSGEENIQWTISTDGNIKERSFKLVKGFKDYYTSPFSQQQRLFEESNFNIVEVIDSTYVLRQQIVNGTVTDSIIYSDNNKKEEIEKIVKQYCKK